MSGKFLSKTTRKQGWPVKGALRNPQVHAWPGFLFNRKETLTIECPVALTYPHLAQPSPPVVTGVLARLHAYLVALWFLRQVPHTGERARRFLLILPARVAPLAPRSLARSLAEDTRRSASRAGDSPPSLSGNSYASSCLNPYPAEVRAQFPRLLPLGFHLSPDLRPLPVPFPPFSPCLCRPYFYSKLYLL